MKMRQSAKLFLFTIITFLSLNLSAQSIFLLIENGDIQGVKSYIENGGDLDLKFSQNFAKNWTDTTSYIDYDLNILEYSIRKSEWKIVDLLVDNSDKFKSWDECLNSSLSAAIQTKNEDRVKQMLNLGADIDYVCTSCYDQSAIGLILTYRLYDLFPYFLDNGAKLQHKNNLGYSLLHIIANSSHTEIAQTLIERGLDLDKVDAFGDTPLQIALAEKKFEMANFFIKEGANVNIPDGTKVTPLMLASLEGDLHTLKNVIKHGAKLDVVDQDGADALYYGIESKNIEIVECLLESGFDPNKKHKLISDKFYETPLLHALYYGNPRICRELINAGALVDDKDYLKIAHKNFKDPNFDAWLKVKFESSN